MLPVLAELGKGIRTAEQGDGRLCRGRPSPCVNGTDTESDHDRFRRKIPLSPMGTWDHCFLLGWGSLVEQESILHHRLSPRGGAPIAAVGPSFDLPLSGTGVRLGLISCSDVDYLAATSETNSSDLGSQLAPVKFPKGDRTKTVSITTKEDNTAERSKIFGAGIFHLGSTEVTIHASTPADFNGGQDSSPEEDGGGQKDGRAEEGDTVVIACCTTPPVFQSGKQILNFVTHSLQGTTKNRATSLCGVSSHHDKVNPGEGLTRPAGFSKGGRGDFRTALQPLPAYGRACCGYDPVECKGRRPAPPASWGFCPCHHLCHQQLPPLPPITAAAGGISFRTPSAPGKSLHPPSLRCSRRGPP